MAMLVILMWEGHNLVLQIPFLMEFFLEFLGYDDGCYNDWSLDLLVAKKVKWIMILIACNVYKSPFPKLF